MNDILEPDPTSKQEPLLIYVQEFFQPVVSWQLETEHGGSVYTGVISKCCTLELHFFFLFWTDGLLVFY